MTYLDHKNLLTLTLITIFNTLLLIFLLQISINYDFKIY